MEKLVVGDTLITLDGEDAAIMWIGRRSIDLQRHPKPEKVQPIRIAADAFGQGAPSRDLILSPDHALFLEGHLVPAKALVNGADITQLQRKSVTYYHVELAKHSVIFADNLAVETYLETGNRGSFENGGARSHCSQISRRQCGRRNPVRRLLIKGRWWMKCAANWRSDGWVTRGDSRCVGVEARDAGLRRHER